jgi:ribosome-associated translation inhibitor RaiA
MRTSLRYLGINAQPAWKRLVREHLGRLQRLTCIESAQVVLEQRRDNNPPFRARVVLVVPGPDFHADAADHTLTAALRKAVESLDRQVRARETNRRANGKSNLHLGRLSNRHPSALTGHRP